MISRRSFLKFGAAFSAALVAWPVKALAASERESLLPVEHWFEKRCDHMPSCISYPGHMATGYGIVTRHFLRIGCARRETPFQEMFQRHGGTVNSQPFLKARPGNVLFLQANVQAIHAVFIDGKLLQGTIKSIKADDPLLKRLTTEQRWALTLIFDEMNDIKPLCRPWAFSDFNDMVRTLRRP